MESEEDQKLFESSVEGVVALVERLITVMEKCPFPERNEQIAAMTGLFENAGISDKAWKMIGQAAVVMLMRERQGLRDNVTGTPPGTALLNPSDTLGTELR